MLAWIMQKLISLFAEALEIMNIKAKLNVFALLTDDKRKYELVLPPTNHFLVVSLFNESLGVSRCDLAPGQVKIVTRAPRCSSASSICNFKLKANKSRKLVLLFSLIFCHSLPFSLYRCRSIWVTYRRLFSSLQSRADGREEEGGKM